MTRPLEERLLSVESKLSTSAVGRLGRTAWSALRGRKLFGGGGPEEDIQAMVTSIGQLKGVAMKVGQILSYVDVALPEDVRAALATLQTASPAMPVARVRELLAAEFGPRAADLDLEDTPVAAASIGQVHRARLPDGRRVAVKVRYPEIAQAIAADFGPAAFGSRFASFFFPGARVDAFVREARERFLLECDYAHEARCQQRFGAILAGHPTLAVPAVVATHGGPGVLTSAWVDGRRFDDYLASAPPSQERDRVGQALFEFYVGTLYRHGLYNCDPHPGNYLFHDGGRVTVLDYGCTREFEPAFVASLAALTRAVQDDRREALHAAFVGLGLVREGKRYDFETARGLMRSFYGPMLRDETLAVEPGAARGFRDGVASKRELLKLTLPGELLFLFRIRFGLMSILARLGARANWYQLERSFGSRLA